MLQPWRSATLLTIIPESNTTWRFIFKCDDLGEFDFVPGQFITLDLPISEKRREKLRSYSISSAPDGGNIFELIVVLLPQGKGSGYLFNELNIGDRVTYRGPSGMFTLPKIITNDLCFVCTGTGIAPFRSQLLNFQNSGFPQVNINLIFGTRYVSNLLYLDEMLTLQNNESRFHYHIALSRENNATNVAFTKGYVHPLYQNVLSQHPNSHFYICGWQVMVDSAKENLLALGVSEGRIHVELYG